MKKEGMIVLIPLTIAKGGLGRSLMSIQGVPLDSRSSQDSSRGLLKRGLWDSDFQRREDRDPPVLKGTVAKGVTDSKKASALGTFPPLTLLHQPPSAGSFVIFSAPNACLVPRFWSF